MMHIQSEAVSPNVKLSYACEDDPLGKRFIIQAIEYATGRRKLEKMYADVNNTVPDSRYIWEDVIERLSIQLNYNLDMIGKIPKQGPLVFISNHPFGVVDGLILGHIVSLVRDRFVVLVNEVLCRYERLAPYLLPIDFRETKDAMRTNIMTRQKVIDRLKDGEALAIFPAGGVATSHGWWGQARDLQWKRFVTKVIRLTEATVVPVYVHGQNSRLFQIVSQFSLTLRLSLLLNEVRNKIGKEIDISIGEPISFNELKDIKDKQEMLNHLRDVTYGLSNSNMLYY